MKRERLETMPFDKTFTTVDGHEESCHSTGYEVFIDHEWWNEYVDAEGYFHYGR